MPSVRTFVALLGAFLLSAPVFSQDPPAARPRSAGTLNTSVSDRIRAEVFYDVPEADHVRFIVLWRGQPLWDRGSGARSGAAGGSIRNTTTMSMSSTAGGMVTSTTTSAGITREVRFDAQTAQVVVNGQFAGTTARDATLIAMVDRVDEVGGPIEISTVSVAAVSRAAIPSGRDSVDSTTGAVIPRSARTGLVEVLSKNPITAEFIK